MWHNPTDKPRWQIIMNYIIGLDLETTGIGEAHRIIEYCGMAYDSKMQLMPTESILTRINPKREIDPAAEAVHHISLADLMGEPFWEDVAKNIHTQLSNAKLIVIHNADFDANFLRKEFERVGLPTITTPTYCTMRSSRWATYNGKVPKLQELCLATGNEYDVDKAHGARYDVSVMMECLKVICKTGHFNKNYLCPFNEVNPEFYLKADGLTLGD